MRLYDCHAHLADPRLADALDEHLLTAAAAGVAGILATAARLGEWDRIEALSRRPTLHGALGLHPFFIDQAPAGFDLAGALRRRLAANPRLVAVGEVGLDFYHGRQDAERQRAVLAAQLEVARAMERPVVVHNRRSWNDFFGLLREMGFGSLHGICHCFNGSREVARQVLDLGLMVSFCGPLTWPQSTRVRAAAAYVPLDRILTETDCPDLPPAPCRGGLSLPWHVRYVVEALAQVKGLTAAAVADQVEANYLAVLGLPRP